MGGYLTLAVAVAALALVPISKESGEKLEAHVGENALIERHAELADSLLPWVIGLVVVAAALLWWNIREKRAAASDSSARTAPGRVSRWLPVTLVALAVAVGAGTMVDAVLVGHSGATAGAALGLIGSSLLFAVAHGAPVLLPYMVTLGLCLGLISAFHRNIWASIIAHTTLNASVSVRVIASVV